MYIYSSYYTSKSHRMHCFFWEFAHKSVEYNITNDPILELFTEYMYMYVYGFIKKKHLIDIDRFCMWLLHKKELQD